MTKSKQTLNIAYCLYPKSHEEMILFLDIILQLDAFCHFSDSRWPLIEYCSDKAQCVMIQLCDILSLFVSH